MISVLALLALIGGEVYLQATGPEATAPPADMPVAERPAPPVEPAAVPVEPIVADAPAPPAAPETADSPREASSVAGTTGISRTTQMGIATDGEAEGRGPGGSSK